MNKEFFTDEIHQLFFEYILAINGVEKPSTVPIKKIHIDFGPNFYIGGKVILQDTVIGLVYSNTFFMGKPQDYLFSIILRCNDSNPENCGMVHFVRTCLLQDRVKDLIANTEF